MEDFVITFRDGHITRPGHHPITITSSTKMRCAAQQRARECDATHSLATSLYSSSQHANHVDGKTRVRQRQPFFSFPDTLHPGGLPQGKGGSGVKLHKSSWHAVYPRNRFLCLKVLTTSCTLCHINNCCNYKRLLQYKRKQEALRSVQEKTRSNERRARCNLHVAI